MNKIEQEKQTCELNLNKTVNIARLRHRQLFKCTGQLERTQQMQVDKFKDALDELYSNFINLLYNA